MRWEPYSIYETFYGHMSLLRYKYKTKIKASQFHLNYNLRGVAPIDQPLLALGLLLMRVMRGHSDFENVLTVSDRVQVLSCIVNQHASRIIQDTSLKKHPAPFQGLSTEHCST
jgi:hypothetical protein